MVAWRLTFYVRTLAGSDLILTGKRSKNIIDPLLQTLNNIRVDKSMGKKPKSDPNRYVRLLIYSLFALIAGLFLYFSHRYYVFSKENGTSMILCSDTTYILTFNCLVICSVEILRSDYQKFLRNAKEVLATMKNASHDGGDTRRVTSPQFNTKPSFQETDVVSTSNMRETVQSASLKSGLSSNTGILGGSSDIVIGFLLSRNVALHSLQ